MYKSDVAEKKNEAKDNELKEKEPGTMADGQSLWYKDAVIYQLHVKAFYDKNKDGIGDFQGLIAKLDYLENLGITAIWLLPFYPSPLKDDGYDISDPKSIHPDYGSLRDFQVFLKEAHKRGIRVVTELVLNHTSDQHAWFKRARLAKPGSVYRNYYVWSDNPEKYSEARIIFKDFENSNWAWDPVAKAYYWHRFYSHQPDLNYDHPPVKKAMFEIIDYWFAMGVDGLRLDAVPYLYEREGTNCENLKETYDLLRELRTYIDKRYPDKMLLAEANQWPEDAAAYFGKGDLCHMAFHFPLMPRMYIALQMEDSFPVLDILDQTPPIPDNCQWAIFLRNHDELTLEMVTDEERDYMYRVYAKDTRARINLGIRRRLAPLLSNDRRKITLLNVLLFSLPGTPVIYYGDEIGMGDNYYLGDRDGVRTPMQWNADRNAGFSQANPQQLYLPVIIDTEYHYEATNVENQQKNSSSLLWWMRRLIAVRKRYKAFSRGSIKFLNPHNHQILAFIREYQNEELLVVVNLSHSPQAVNLELTNYVGYVPQEIMSKNNFPPVHDHPYLLTLGGYGYFLFQLKKQEDPFILSEPKQTTELLTTKTWLQFPDYNCEQQLEREILPAFLPRCRWFGEKALTIQKVEIVENIPIPIDGLMHLFILEISYLEGSSSRYLLPVSLAIYEKASQILDLHPESIIGKIRIRGIAGFVYDGVYDDKFARYLLRMIGQRKKLKGRTGELSAYVAKGFRNVIAKQWQGKNEEEIPTQLLKAEQSNTSIIYDNLFILKLYRKLEEGISVDIEMVRYLTEQARFPYTPSFTGSIEYQRDQNEPTALCMLQEYVLNQGDAWLYTRQNINTFFDNILAHKPDAAAFSTAQQLSLFELATNPLPPAFVELAGDVYLDMISLLGKRTGEMHLALARPTHDPAFRVERFTTLYQRALYQAMRVEVRRTLQLLAKQLYSLPWEIQEQSGMVLAAENVLLAELKRITQKKLSAAKIRVHGDYHLGQVIFTGRDFVIIDFEGEPARALSERRLKRSPLRDVVGMIRSFHYAVYSLYYERKNEQISDWNSLQNWLEIWFYYISGRFLQAYLSTVKDSTLLPEDVADFNLLLNAFQIEKSLYELSYELNNRPDWLLIPIKGILQIVKKLKTT